MYYVVGGDGKEYGPVDMVTLNMWASEGRVNATSQVKDASGMLTTIGALPGFQPPISSTLPPVHAYDQTPNPYPRAQYSVPQNAQKPVPRSGLVWWCIAYIALGPILRYFIGGLGFISSGYAVYYAFRLKQAGHPWGLGLVIASIISLVLVLVGFIIKPY